MWTSQQIEINLKSWWLLLIIIIYNINIVCWAEIVDDQSIQMMYTTVNSLTTSLPTNVPPPLLELNTCFYAEPDLCTLPRDNESCRECLPHPIYPNSLVCCNVTDIDKAISCVPTNTTSDTSSYWSNLHIRNATLNELDIPHKYLKRLNSLVITDGHINNISSTFAKFSSLKCINISNNNLIYIYPRAFKDLVHLQILDISHNNLSTIPNIATNLTLDIRGNGAMLCKNVLETIERGSINFAGPDTTYCLTNQTFNWFNSTDSIPLRQLERMKQLQSECPFIVGHGNCTCEAERMTYEPQAGGPHLVFAAKVDCSGLRLLELPKKLPMNTLFLNVSNNNITSLSALNDNPTYQNILRLYADENEISSILDLEGTKFIEDFDTLSLRQNKLKSIPIYLLSNTLDRSPPAGRLLYLEGNQLYCDCNSAKVLKLWLLARQNHITDYDRILCENINSKVVDLSEMKLCQSQHDWTDYIYYLIAAEVLLLLALIMKVTYDYWIFKTAGYLPWPASKMPKLPCDWLCES